MVNLLVRLIKRKNCLLRWKYQKIKTKNENGRTLRWIGKEMKKIIFDYIKKRKRISGKIWKFLLRKS